MTLLDEVNAHTREAYNLAAHRYHELFAEELEGKPYDRKLLDGFAAHYGPASLLCDAGCGPSAHIGRYLREKGIPVMGVDISDECARLARRHNPGMRVLCADMGELPLGGETLDGVVAYYSILDTPKSLAGRFIAEFHRVLRPGGRLLVAVKAGKEEGYREELLGVKTRIYFSLFTMEEIRSYFQEGGFSVELLDERAPYPSEIAVGRIYGIGRRL
ncbi:MAG: class I SAM-dependent methyltransferase [Bacteroidota bacterium]